MPLLYVYASHWEATDRRLVATTKREGNMDVVVMVHYCFVKRRHRFDRSPYVLMTFALHTARSAHDEGVIDGDRRPVSVDGDICH